jgi:hypothetical protein
MDEYEVLTLAIQYAQSISNPNPNLTMLPSSLSHGRPSACSPNQQRGAPIHALHRPDLLLRCLVPVKTNIIAQKVLPPTLSALVYSAALHYLYICISVARRTVMLPSTVQLSVKAPLGDGCVSSTPHLGAPAAAMRSLEPCRVAAR